MAIITIPGRGLRTAAGFLMLLSLSLLLSACWLFPKPSVPPVNDIVALVGQSSGGTTAGVHVFSNDGKGNLSVGPVLEGTSQVSKGYTDLALGNIADHAVPSNGGSPVNDIFVTNNGQGPNQVWINNGSGTFTQHTETWSTQNSTAVALGPVVGVSGEVDAVVANGTNAPTTWENASKDGSFTNYPTGEGVFGMAYKGSYDARAIAMGLLTGTGGTPGDVVFGNYGQQDLIFQDMAGQNGTYQGTTTTTGANLYGSDDTQAVAIGDLNGDGLPDLFVANSGQNYAYLNSNSGGSYTLQSPPVNVGPTTSNSTAVALAKLGGGSAMYAFVVNSGSSATVWKYNGSGGFTQVAESSQFDNATSASGTAVAIGDLNGDGIPDAVVASGGANGTITVWLGNGDGTFSQASEPNIPSGDYVAVAIGRLR